MKLKNFIENKKLNDKNKYQTKTKTNTTIFSNFLNDYRKMKNR